MVGGFWHCADEVAGRTTALFQLPAAGIFTTSAVASAATTGRCAAQPIGHFRLPPTLAHPAYARSQSVEGHQFRAATMGRSAARAQCLSHLSWIIAHPHHAQSLGVARIEAGAVKQSVARRACYCRRHPPIVPPQQAPDGNFAHYGEDQQISGVTDCADMCDEHNDCAGFYTKDGRCSHWRSGSLTVSENAGHCCYRK